MTVLVAFILALRQVCLLQLNRLLCPHSQPMDSIKSFVDKYDHINYKSIITNSTEILVIKLNIQAI